MTFDVSPYVLMTSQAEEAREFYEDIFGAETRYIQRISDRTESAKIGIAQNLLNRIDQAVLSFGNITLMLADDTEGLPVSPGSHISLCLTFETVEEAKGIYDKMVSSGAEILKPFTPEFYTEGYGFVRDPFGVSFHVFTKRKE
ncbi:VOC family protein [Rossellomorea marisflavi]|uniref:VOC family protein n=1 Tax=Rossellomorea marisflavi TaxID=189381 RepID=UPI00296FFFE9|nr:VOC family protein [Rossellomorea marisflavi]MDW4528254.1 VOC family protein [Rossellomorea marisflavi]